jgi:hypothetical protein
MRWLKPNLRSSIYALLGCSPAPRDFVQEVGVEDIRSAMLGLIAEVADKKYVHVVRRIRYATEVLSLWYLRGDLMSALASKHGEAQAREKLRPITAMFKDIVPQGLKSSRPSPLDPDSKI